MTDKQIIIDVCPYQGECSVSGCKRNDDGCFVRQLFEERYRAENQIVELNKTIKAKEQECEELKEWQQTVKDMFNRTCRCKYNDEVSAMCKLTNKKCISINECMYRKHKTLTEIKEIAESEMDSKEFMAIQRILNGSVDNKNKVLKQILQKISEVENGQ